MSNWSNTNPSLYFTITNGVRSYSVSLDSAFKLAQPGDTVVVEMARVPTGCRAARYEPAAWFWF